MKDIQYISSFRRDNEIMIECNIVIKNPCIKDTNYYFSVVIVYILGFVVYVINNIDIVEEQIYVKVEVSFGV